MSKISRTFRLDVGLIDSLDRLSVNHGDLTRHLEAALRAYGPIKKLMQGKPQESIEVPEGINTGAWLEWVEFRRTGIKKKITPAAAKKQFKLLLKYTPEQQQAIIDTSIQNDYQGLFDLKGGNYENNKPDTSKRRPSAVDRVRIATEERASQSPERHDLAQAGGDLWPPASEPIRGSNAGELGVVIEGTYGRHD